VVALDRPVATQRLERGSFCARHDLATASFYAWRRTLERRDGAAVAFVPVKLAADVGTASVVEVVLANGCVVRVAPGFDATTLRQVLTLLRGEQPC
jgi:hypothetical protein